MNLLNGWKCPKCGKNEIIETEAGVVKHLLVSAVRKDSQGYYVEANTVLEETGGEFPIYSCRGCDHLIGNEQELVAMLRSKK